MAIIEIKDGDTILAKLIPNEDWVEGLAFFSDDSDFIQVGTWGYDAGKELLGHVHNNFERKAFVTQEVLYIRKGKVKAKIYDLNDKPVDEVEAKEGDTMILLNGGHGYSILEDGTQVLEVKNGPYAGPDKDRRRL